MIIARWWVVVGNLGMGAGYRSPSTINSPGNDCEGKKLRIELTRFLHGTNGDHIHEKKKQERMRMWCEGGD